MGCGQRTYTETYWCPGWWPWQWFRTCTRTVTKWCCDFTWLRETGWVFFSTMEGCAGGQRYSWVAFSFNIIGTSTYYNMTKCFDSPMSPSGKC